MIYVTGDTHGELVRFDSPEIRRLKKEDTLIICGDFGFLWDGGQKEEDQLRKLGKKKYRILFLDGTHENFDLLAKYAVSDWNGGKVQHICGNLYHLMRGQVYEIEGKKIFAFGGGDSGAEKELRMKTGHWWPQEMPSIEEMREAANNLESAGMQVDYILTHNPPPKVVFGSAEKTENRNQLEAFFEQLVKHVKFGKWFFGSQHIDRKITYKTYAVYTSVLPVEQKEVRRRLFSHK